MKDNLLTEFNTGGSHSENPLGGIPIGINPQSGAPVTVEEGETKTKIGGNDFIFSNDFKINKSLIKEFKLPENLSGLSMSDASKKISKIYEDRADGISKNTEKQFLGRLADAQEKLKSERLQKVQEAMQTNMNYMDESLPQQVPPGMEEFVGQQQMAGGGFFNALLGNQTPEQQNINLANRDARYAAATARNENGSDLNIMGNAATNVVSAAPTLMGLINQAQGNTSPNVTQSALSGAMTGLSAGAAFGPIGMGVGAVGGLIAGHIGGNKAKKNLINQSNDAAMNYNAQFQEQYASGGFPILGGQTLTNNAYGGYGNNKPQQPFYGFPVNGKLMNPFQSNTVQGVADEAQFYGSQNPIINAQNYLTNNNYSLTGGADGKWGPSSQKNLDAWRKAQGLNVTGPLSATDYQAMGYNPQGYTPFDNTELEGVTIDVNRAQAPTTSATSEVPVANTPTTPTDPTKKPNFDYNNLLRYMTPLNNVLQLGSLQRPQMGNLNQDLTRADRNYIDENTIARNIRNQGNTLNRSIQGSGMTEGARRASMVASNLNTQEALGSAFIQAQQANRQIDQVADQTDAQTRQSNQRNRMLAEENYQRDKGAYNTEKSKLTAQMFTDIGNIGLEGTRIKSLENVYGYDQQGNFIKNNKTGEQYDNAVIPTLISDKRNEIMSGKFNHDAKLKRQKEAEVKQLEEQYKKIQEKSTKKSTK